LTALRALTLCRADDEFASILVIGVALARLLHGLTSSTLFERHVSAPPIAGVSL
jgi:hypothetical protein